MVVSDSGLRNRLSMSTSRYGPIGAATHAESVFVSVTGMCADSRDELNLSTSSGETPSLHVHRDVQTVDELQQTSTVRVLHLQNTTVFSTV